MCLRMMSTPYNEFSLDFVLTLPEYIYMNIKTIYMTNGIYTTVNYRRLPKIDTPKIDTFHEISGILKNLIILYLGSTKHSF